MRLGNMSRAEDNHRLRHLRAVRKARIRAVRLGPGLTPCPRRKFLHQGGFARFEKGFAFLYDVCDMERFAVAAALAALARQLLQVRTDFACGLA